VAIPIQLGAYLPEEAAESAESAPPQRPALAGYEALIDRLQVLRDHWPESLSEFIRERLEQFQRPLLALALVCLMAGGLAGHQISRFIAAGRISQLEAAVASARLQSQAQESQKISSLKKERARLQTEARQATAYSLEYAEGSIPRALAQAAAEEFKIADTLLLQQIAALESGAKITVDLKQTAPDPELAATLAEEMKNLQTEIDRQWQAARGLSDTPRMLATTSVTTQLLSLAILNRNHLIAKYGLSSPLPLPYRSPQTAALPGPAPGLTDIETENARLKADNDMLLNSDSTIYASAVNDLGAGSFASAEAKFRKMLKMFPASPLAPKAQEGLELAQGKMAENESAQKSPLVITATGVRHDGGYFRNESYVRVAFRNTTGRMIKKIEFKVLTFDQNGYPVASRRLAMTQDNVLSAAMTENVAPGKGDYGVWEISEKVRQVKVRLKEVEFYDAPPWFDKNIEAWVQKEGARFQSGKSG
jgi:TolA-binding protein